MKKSRGITLIALVITIILLLILAGVVLTLTLGEHGIINLAKNAKNEYENAELNEIKDLDKLYSSIKIANGSTITLTQEELDEYIKTKASPTGVKTDVYIHNQISTKTAYTATSMNGFTRTADANNKIAEYLSYSNEDGYTVLKSGWYFIREITRVQSSGAASSDIGFCVNGVGLDYVYAWTGNGIQDNNHNAYSIYLKEGDKVYFTSTGVNSASLMRISEGYIYPMF